MIDIRPIVHNGEYFINVSMDGHEMRQHGPYRDADEAEAAARHLSGVCTVLNQAARVFKPTTRAQRR